MSNWIKANESLPTESGLYLVHVEWDEGKGVMTLHYNAEEKKWCYDNHGSIGEPIYSMSWYLGVLHWQTLPEAPNKEEQQKSDVTILPIIESTYYEEPAWVKKCGCGQMWCPICHG